MFIDSVGFALFIALSTAFINRALNLFEQILNGETPKSGTSIVFVLSIVMVIIVLLISVKQW